MFCLLHTTELVSSGDRAIRTADQRQFLSGLNTRLSIVMNYSTLAIVIISFLATQSASVEESDDYQGLSKQKFRTQNLNVIWNEALMVRNFFELKFLTRLIDEPSLIQHLKGQKLKNLMTELKAHEKAVLNVKKKKKHRSAPDEEGGSLQFKNLKWIDEAVNLEQDLENILFVTTWTLSSPQMKLASKFDHSSEENHINSVLEMSEGINKKKYDEPRVELLHAKHIL